MNNFRFRHTLTLMLAAVSFWGCSDTFVSGDDAELSPMHFSTASLTSRAVTTNESFLQAGNKFKVWGSYESRTNTAFKSTKVFDGVDVTRTSEGAWSYDEPRYWLPGFRYDFRAIHPVAIADKVTYTIGESGNDTPTFTIDDYDVRQGYDILYAAPAPINAVSGPMSPVVLNFKHILSRVAFVGRSDEQHLGEGRRIIIDAARLYGIRTAGTWNGQTSDDTSLGSWTPTGELLGETSTVYYAASVELQTDGTNLFTDESALFFLPQSLKNAVLAITYHYNYSDTDQPLQFNGSVRLSELSEKWESGKSYRYPFTISNHIFFQPPTVEEWKQAPINSPDFNVDIDRANP